MQRSYKSTLCLIVLGFGLVMASAHAGEWFAEPDSGQLTYRVAVQGASVEGSFERFQVSVTEDISGNPAAIRVQVDMHSVAMAGEDINEAIRQPEWFDVAGFSRAWFRSQTIRATPDGQYLAIGELQLKGVARTIKVYFDWQVLEGGAAQFSGYSELQRLDFGIGRGEWESGEDVGLQVLVQFDLRMRTSR